MLRNTEPSRNEELEPLGNSILSLHFLVNDDSGILKDSVDEPD